MERFTGTRLDLSALDQQWPGARGLQRGTLRASFLHRKGQRCRLWSSTDEALRCHWSPQARGCSSGRGRGSAAQSAPWPGPRPAPRPRASAHTHSPVLIQLAQPATPEKSNSISALWSSTIPPSRCSQSWGTGASFKDTCMPPTRRCICCLSLRLYTPSWLLTREEGKLGWVLFHFLNRRAKLVLVC